MILALIIVGILALPFLAENVANGSLGLSAATRSTKNGAITQIKDLHPFKHLHPPNLPLPHHVDRFITEIGKPLVRPVRLEQV